MFHVKVWLGVIFFAVVTLQIWIMQPLLIYKVAEEQDRLRPILVGQRFERGLFRFYEKLKAKTTKMAEEPGLREAVKSINYEADDDLSKLETYEDARRKIQRNFQSYQKLDSKGERLYVVSREGIEIGRAHV